MKASYEARDGYLYVVLRGEFTPLAAMSFSSECVDQARRHSLNRLLCDIIGVTGYDNSQVLTMTRFDLSRFVARVLPQGFKLAVLETPQQLKGGRFDEDVMVNRGATVKVISNLNEALEWLGVASTDEPAEAETQ